jgi:hypothetical protein
MRCDINAAHVATVAVTTDGVLLWPSTDRRSMKTKKNSQYLVAILHPLLELQWQQWEYCHKGCRAMSQHASELWYSGLYIKMTPPFLGPKRCKRFLDLKHKRNPFSVPKKYGILGAKPRQINWNTF